MDGIEGPVTHSAALLLLLPQEDKRRGRANVVKVMDTNYSEREVTKTNDCEHRGQGLPQEREENNERNLLK